MRYVGSSAVMGHAKKNTVNTTSVTPSAVGQRSGSNWTRNHTNVAAVMSASTVVMSAPLEWPVKMTSSAANTTRVRTTLSAARRPR